MAFRVTTALRAEKDIASAYKYIVEAGAPEAATRWYQGIKAHIETLTEMPGRCSMAPEAEKLGYEVRQLHYGKRGGTYRILFRILPEKDEVHVIAVRHGARREFETDDED